MPGDSSIRAFKCPTCGAPLEPVQGALTMKCGYCGSSIVIPQSLRTPPIASSSGIPQYNFGGIDLNAVVGGAMLLPEVLSLAESGRMDEAAQLYSQITGLSHADAIRSVTSMAAGQAVSIVPGTTGGSWQQPQTTNKVPSLEANNPAFDQNAASSEIQTTNRGCSGVLIAVLVAAIVLVIAAIAAGILIFSNAGSNSNPLSSVIPAGFAGKTLAFGSEGIGPGMFADPRSIAVDSNGKIYVAEYQDGRIQTFDPNGKFISMFSVGPKVYINEITVGRDGRIYAVSTAGKLHIFDLNGKQLNLMIDDNHRYTDVTLGADGKLYAVANDDTIERFNSDGNIDLEIKDTFKNITGKSDFGARLAVDGLGYMYLLGPDNYLILKFSPAGKYINQFGGESKDNSQASSGKFISPRNIAVDG